MWPWHAHQYLGGLFFSTDPVLFLDSGHSLKLSHLTSGNMSCEILSSLGSNAPQAVPHDIAFVFTALPLSWLLCSALDVAVHLVQLCSVH